MNNQFRKEIKNATESLKIILEGIYEHLERGKISLENEDNTITHIIICIKDLEEIKKITESNKDVTQTHYIK